MPKHVSVSAPPQKPAQGRTFIYYYYDVRTTNEALVIKNRNSTIRSMRKPIAQKHEFGCGVASVAFVVGKSYTQALQFFDTKKANSLGFCCRDLAKALKGSGFNYEYKYLKPKLRRKIYQESVIVFIKRSKDYPDGHYLARGGGYWMDPWMNFKSDKNIKNARARLRKRLPGKPVYALFPKECSPPLNL